MRIKQQSIFLGILLAMSSGLSTSTQAQSVTKPIVDACSEMLVPDGVICLVSPKTGQSVAVSEECLLMASVISIMPGTDPFKEGVSFNGGLFCKRDLGTGLVIGILPTFANILPPITARQQRAQAILAAVTPSMRGDTCKGMNIPNGMICLVNPITERPRAHWNHCLNWTESKDIACMIDPETGYVKTVPLPEEPVPVK
jgi:hypothetical protein